MNGDRARKFLGWMFTRAVVALALTYFFCKFPFGPLTAIYMGY